MKGQGSGIPKSKVKNWEASRRVGKVRRRAIVEREKERHAEKDQDGEERNPRGSLVRLCEIKTRFTGSFYCGYCVSFVSLWTRATVPFNRFNEYIVLQWSRWEYHILLFFLFFLNNYLPFPPIFSFRLLFVSLLLIPLAVFAQQTKHLKRSFTKLRTFSRSFTVLFPVYNENFWMDQITFYYVINAAFRIHKNSLKSCKYSCRHVNSI